MWRAERSLNSPAIQRKLRELREVGYNFDPSRRAQYTPENGWRKDDFCQALPAEVPGVPEPAGSWEVARRLMWGYEFADPSIVQAFYDPEEPLEGRTMLLELRFRGLIRFDAGTRVAQVYDDERDIDGRRARVWGWAYCTLQGHLEKGQMDWQVWKWLHSGEVEFRIHAYSKRSSDPNLLIQLGFRLFGRHEQLTFLRSSLRRMARLTETALREEDTEPVHAEAERLTARRGFSTRTAHEQLVGRIKDR